jgi:hypothetical protein
MKALKPVLPKGLALFRRLPVDRNRSKFEQQFLFLISEFLSEFWIICKKELVKWLQPHLGTERQR